MIDDTEYYVEYRLEGTTHAPNGRKLTLNRRFKMRRDGNLLYAASACLRHRNDNGYAYLGCGVKITCVDDDRDITFCIVEQCPLGVIYLEKDNIK